MAKDEVDKNFSFDFYPIMEVRTPTVEEVNDPTKLAAYFDQFMDGDRPKKLKIKFYTNPDKTGLIKTFQAEPNLIIGTESAASINLEDGSMTIFYDRYNGRDNWLTIEQDGLVSKIQKMCNPRFTIKGANNTPVDTVEVKDLKKTFFQVDSRDASLEDYFEKDELLNFESRFPISYSTKEDIRYTRSNGNPKHERRLYLSDNQHFVLLSEILENKLVFLNRTENYSPKDGVVRIDSKLNQKGVPLYKENTRDILKARIYSDFIGFDETNPNGLVQTEVSKRFFLNTSSTSSFQNFMYSGYFNYVEPNLVVAKIEENNKYLPLRELVTFDEITGAPVTLNYASSLDILNYSTFQIGGMLGLSYFSFPKYHVRLQLGVGGYIFQSGFANELISEEPDSDVVVRTDNEFIANSLVYHPDIRMEFNPDPRFNLEVAYRPTFVTLLNNDVLQVDNEARFLQSRGRVRTDKVVHVMQLQASIRVNQETNGQFFFRSNFSLSGDDRNTNFLQAQIGYAFNIFTRVTEQRSKDKNDGNGAPASPSATGSE